MSSTAVVFTSWLALSFAGPRPASLAVAAPPAPHPSWTEGEGEGEAPAEPAVEPAAAAEAGAVASPDAEPDPAGDAIDPIPADGSPADGSEGETGGSVDGQSTAPAEGDPAPLAVPDKNGLGLLIASGAVAAVSWGTMGWRMAIVRNGCRDDTELETVTEEDIEELVGSGVGCADARVRSGLAWGLQSIPNATVWGLAPAGGALRGKYDAARFVLEGGPERNDKLFIGLGASLLGAGAIGRIVVAFIRIRSLIRVDQSYVASCIEGDTTTPEQFFDCYARKNMLHFFGHQFTSASVGAGAGLLAYGIAYNKTRDKYQKGQSASQARLQLSIVPQLSVHHTGVAATLRF